MAARRLIFVMIVMLMLSSFAAALVPTRDRDETSTTSTTTEPQREPATGGKLVEERLDASAKGTRTIRVALGDQVALSVASDRTGEVEIPGLGALDDVEPGTPAVFDLLPFEEGAYDVRLVVPDRLIGQIIVGPARPETDKRSRKGAGNRDR